jgi:hypothetical protein
MGQGKQLAKDFKQQAHIEATTPHEDLQQQAIEAT